MKKEKKPYRAAPPVSGTMQCQKGHTWNVIDLNPERKAVNCPVCGGYTDILRGTGKK